MEHTQGSRLMENAEHYGKCSAMTWVVLLPVYTQGCLYNTNFKWNHEERGRTYLNSKCPCTVYIMRCVNVICYVRVSAFLGKSGTFPAMCVWCVKCQLLFVFHMVNVPFTKARFTSIHVQSMPFWGTLCVFFFLTRWMFYVCLIHFIFCMC